MVTVFQIDGAETSTMYDCLFTISVRALEERAKIGVNHCADYVSCIQQDS